MHLSDFDFDLPTELIAQTPVYPRHASKMLVIGDNLIDSNSINLADFLEPDSLIVLNNSKVIPAKFNTNKLEFNLHQNLGNKTWKAFAKKARKVNIADKIDISDDCYIIIIDKDGGEITIEFHYEHGNDLDAIYKYGEMPLPPYIKKNEAANEHYQTTFAKNEGSMAAPTAGLHFTGEIFAKLKAKNISYCFVTLHVGAGTFLPIKTDNLDDHLMHYETGFIDNQTKDIINNAKKAGKKIIAVGTTSMRLLESATDENGYIERNMVNTNLFIRPGYKFKIVDKLLTNFHFPCTTLFILVCSFAGIKQMKQAYTHAIAQKYRFYSYGDCCLLTKKHD